MPKSIRPATPRRLLVTDIHTLPSFGVGTPAAIPFEGAQFGGQGRNYDVTSDGKRVLVVMYTAGATDPARRPPSQINVVLNWLEELKQKVGGK